MVTLISREKNMPKFFAEDCTLRTGWMIEQLKKFQEVASVCQSPFTRRPCQSTLYSTASVPTADKSWKQGTMLCSWSLSNQELIY